MRPLLVTVLAAQPLPGDARLSWLDLVEQVCLERGVSRDALLADDRSHAVCRARHHIWAALAGGGVTRELIARRFARTPVNVRTAVAALQPGPRWS